MHRIWFWHCQSYNKPMASLFPLLYMHAFWSLWKLNPWEYPDWIDWHLIGLNSCSWSLLLSTSAWFQVLVVLLVFHRISNKRLQFLCKTVTLCHILEGLIFFSHKHAQTLMSWQFWQWDLKQLWWLPNDLTQPEAIFWFLLFRDLNFTRLEILKPLQGTCCISFVYILANRKEAPFI